MNKTEWFEILDFKDYQKPINNYENKIYSQNGEDGIIKYIFDNIGTTNKKSCEIGFHYNEANTLNLMKNDWKCLFIDSNNIQIKQFNKIYENVYTNSYAICNNITADNINKIITDNKYNDEIDFLSIDIDSNDYYIVKKIINYNPRVICVEYNSSFGPNIPCSIPYNAKRTDQTVDYWGASYLAFVNLLSHKYNLVAVVAGLNLFFIRNDIKHNIEKISDAWQPPYQSTYKSNNMPKHKDRLKEQYEKIIKLPLYYTNDL
jgi:hypothetical protein